MTAISNIKIWALMSLCHIQYDDIFSGKTFDRQIEHRNGIHTAFDKFADFFRNLLYIGDPNRSIILLQTEKQHPA